MASVLDKLNTVTVDKSTDLLVDPSLHLSLLASATLANSYLDTINEAEKALADHANEQTAVMHELAPYGVSDYAQYFDPRYDPNLKFDEAKEKIVSNFISHVKTSISYNYNVQFKLENETELTAEFVEHGINMDAVYTELSKYLDGKTFAQTKRDEAMTKFMELVEVPSHNRYYRDDNKDVDSLEGRTRLTVGEKDVSIDYFVSTDWDGVRVSYSGQSNLYVLAMFFETVMDSRLDYSINNFTVGFGESYTPPASFDTIVKNVRVFKNGKLKITFKSAEGRRLFTNVISDHLGIESE